MSDPVLLTIDARGVATATFNRPERANAYDETMLTALRLGLGRLARDERVRCLIIRGAGRHFQAGADIEWLGRVAKYTPSQAYAASMATVDACRTLNEWPKPTIAVVHGACFGGGAGMVCCADVVLATPDAQFGLTEVRVGVAPTPISTHMVHAMGLRHTRRYALTGERFDAAEACRIGLVHEVVSSDRIETRLSEVLDAIFLAAPGAIAVTKRSFLGANGWLVDDRLADRLAHESWTQRASAEGQEGTAAFRERRKPAWWVADSGDA
jgi:methylglutaconyl-CoA hydratase